jgi:tRNA(fMet)-specific endonuclease VapC
LAKVADVGVSSLVVEEILIQGHGAEINRVRSGRSRADIDTSNRQFVEAVAFLATFRLIPYTADAEAIFKGFKAAKLKGMDGRIAAHALSLGAILVTENVRDFADIPGLVVENWLDSSP